MGPILLVFAFVCACVAALWPTFVTRTMPHMGWLSVAFYLASLIFGGGMGAVHIGRLGGAMMLWAG
jgi:hypothetical protein